MKCLLFILLISTLLRRLESIRGVVWDKKRNAFLPISNISEFETNRVQMKSKIYAAAHHDFQGESFKLMYFERDDIFEFYDNDTKITGLCGDIWTTLSKSLNFTIIPIKEKRNRIGYGVNATMFVGGVGNISRNEIDIIPLSTMYSLVTLAMDFNMPTWRTGYNLYADWKPRHNKFWIVKVFSWQVWCTVGAMHVLLSICSFLTGRYSRDDRKIKSTVGDHSFHNFAALCNQSSVPEGFSGGSTIFQVVLGFYCFLLYTSFSALLYSHLTYRVPDPPFVDLHTFLHNSDYHMVVVEDSSPHTWFKFNITPDMVAVVEKGRLKVVKTLFELSELICDNPQRKTKYATILDEVTKKTMRSKKCNPDRLGPTLYQVSMASSVRKNFPYKATIEILLLKMRESGIIDILNKRWIERGNLKKTKWDVTDAITINQIFLPLCFYASGVGISIFILLLEICVHPFKVHRHYP